MIYLTSDLHFNHDREFIFKPRGFEGIGEMNNAIVKNWNNVVTEDDDVYVLGDLMLGGSDLLESGIELLKSLNGKLHIIRGNHDTEKRVAAYKALPNVVSVSDAEFLKYGKYNFFLCHYPTMTGSLENESLERTTICLCGHTHDKKKFYNDIPYIYNVACDAQKCTPVLIENVIIDCVEKVKECKQYL